MIDLHTHTNYSDGSDDVITLLKNAENVKLKALSITDHSDCRAYEELKNIDIKKYYTGKLIKGCELFTTIEGQTIELLGYNIDTDVFNKRLPDMYKYSIQDLNKIEYENTLKTCKNIGVHMDYNNIKIDCAKEFPTEVIMKEIIKYPENKNFFDNEKVWGSGYEFYRKCVTNSKSEFFMDYTPFYPTIDEVIDLIKSTGGLVFIPHIFIYGENSTRFFEILTKKYKIDGIECYYTAFTDEQTQFLLEYCSKNNLYISGGSDYHGKRKTNHNLGTGRGNLNISFDIIKKWAKF